MSLVNSFRAVSQATTVVINYHKIVKKDSLNKTYTGVFNVLCKESRKLQIKLENENNRIDTDMVKVR